MTVKTKTYHYYQTGAKALTTSIKKAQAARKKTNQKQGERETVLRTGNAEDSGNRRNVCSSDGGKGDETSHHAE